jgi:hypothetical protein
MLTAMRDNPDDTAQQEIISMLITNQKHKREKLAEAAKAYRDRKKFTFVVENDSGNRKVVKEQADGLTNALNKVLSKHPGKIVITNKFYTFMDLITAKVDGLVKSKQDRSTIFINVFPTGHKNEGDCFFAKKPDNTTQAILKHGSEVSLDSEEGKELMGTEETPATKTPKTKVASKVEEGDTTVTKTSSTKSSNKNNKTMATAVKNPAKKTAKKATAKKSAEKKVAAKVTTTGEKKEAPKPKAGQKLMSVKEILKTIAKGEQKAWNKDGKPLPVGYLTKMADHNKEIIVSFTKVGE